MKTLVIGTNTFRYSAIKELLYRLTGEFYSDNVELFDAVRLKDDNEKEKSICVPLVNGNSVFLKMSPDTIEDWKFIIEELKKKYIHFERVDSKLKSQISNVPTYDEVLSKHRKKIEKIKPTTNVGKLLLYSPVDELGNSETFFFENLKPEHIKLHPNNGVHWDRQLRRYFKVKYEKEKGATIGYKLIGYNLEDVTKNRQIRPDIREAFKGVPCVHCWLPNKDHTKHEIDHKNGRYNHEEVFKYESQDIDQFQSLCRPHNLYKRSCCKKCKETNIRFDATFYGFPVPVTFGKVTYEESVGCKGCYLYDPYEFRSSFKIKDENEIQ